FVQLLRRKRERTTLCNSRLTATSQCNFEIRGKHADLVALRLEQHVRENRDRVLPLDDALEELQFSQKLILPNDQFHWRVLSFEQSGVARGKWTFGGKLSLHRGDQKRYKIIPKKGCRAKLNKGRLKLDAQ